MKAPDPLIIPWQGRQLRVRHDDPHLGPYTPSGGTLRAAIELASDVDGLRLVLATTVGDRFRVLVADPTVIGAVAFIRRAQACPVSIAGRCADRRESFRPAS